MNTTLLALAILVPNSAWLQTLLLVASVAVVLWGADRLTSGAVALAGRMGIPQIVIGLTVVAMGTSMPEFFVSLLSAIGGTPDLAVGNVVGSNIFNALLIVGVAALVTPIDILPTTVRKDIPFALVASALLLMMCLDHEISRPDALVLLALFVVFMVFTVRGAKANAGSETAATETQAKPAANAEPAATQDTAPMSLLKASLLMLLGLVCLVAGSDIFVGNASAIAHSMGVSNAIVGLTIVAGGTSLPELATSAVAAYRGNSGIAIGNVLGSNVFNILMIIGITGTISPMAIVGITTLDLAMMVISIVLLWLFSFTKLRVERWEGAVLAAVFAAYMVHLVGTALA